MQDETYNGWKNYPTWAVNLWLSNDEGLYNETISLTRETIAHADADPSAHPHWTRDETRRFDLADALKDWVTDELAPDLGATFAADLLGWALDHVEWTEIADSMIEATEEVPA